MNQCPHCAAELTEKDTFCPKCGIDIPEHQPAPAADNAAAPAVPAPEKETEKAPKARKKFRFHPMFLIPILLIVGIVVTVILVLNNKFAESPEPVELFNEGLLPVAITNNDGDTMWGYLNKKGELAIPAIYEDAHDFSDNGLAAVCKNGKWGYIDTDGETVIEHRFEAASGFGKYDYAPVQLNGSWGYVDDKGEMAINQQFDEAGVFADNGLACVQIEGKYGYINRDGVYAILPQFEDARSFGSTIYAAVCAYGQWGMINKSGEYVINPQFDELDSFRENGLARVKKGGKYGFIDRKANYVVNPIYLEALPFDNSGLALVRDDSGKYGYINQHGTVVIEPQFDDALPFGDNTIAAVCQDQTWGYIGRDGEFEIEPTYVAASSFHSGLALVRDYNGFAYIDRNGKEKLRYDDDEYTGASSFTEDNYAVIIRLDKKGKEIMEIIDDHGDLVTTLRIDQISRETLLKLSQLK